jgi:hypothetical protein
MKMPKLRLKYVPVQRTNTSHFTVIVTSTHPNITIHPHSPRIVAEIIKTKKREAPIVSFQPSSDYIFRSTVYIFIVLSGIVVFFSRRERPLIDFERARDWREREQLLFFPIAVARLPAKVVIILYPRMPLVSLRRIGRVTIGICGSLSDL